MTHAEKRHLVVGAAVGICAEDFDFVTSVEIGDEGCQGDSDQVVLALVVPRILLAISSGRFRAGGGREGGGEKRRKADIFIGVSRFAIVLKSSGGVPRYWGFSRSGSA
eukprot:1256693-Amorphochlora_amoeboformis.AAC.3